MVYQYNFLPIINKINNIKNNKINLSNNSLNLLKDIIINIDNTSNIWMTYYINDFKITKRSNLNHSSFLPMFVTKQLLKTHDIFNCTFKILERSYSINFIMFDKPTNIKILLTSYIKNIYKWLYVSSKYANNKCSLQTKINIYLTNTKKIFPAKVSLSQEHINSAYTWSCNKVNNYNEINIFREEEWFKVFIHETFHLFNLDFSQEYNKTYNNILSQLFHIKIDFKLYEAYAEVWAEIINILFIAHSKTYKIKSKRNWMINIFKKVFNMLNTETSFSLLQASKILKYNNINYTNLITRNNNINYVEETSIFSYYIIKSMLLFNLDDFLSWCYINNNRSIKFNHNNIIIFYQFITLIYKNPQYINIINFIDTNIINKFNLKNPIINTLRFSINQLY
jgi:ribosomal protein L28